VSTRKLIGIALLCGLAILIAGGIQLFRISDTGGRTVAVLAEGDRATVGGITVTVEGSAFGPNGLTVGVSLASASDRETVPVTSFTLLAGGALQQATGDDTGETSSCPSTIDVDPSGTRCFLSFPSGKGTATLGFSRGGEQRIWRLDPAST
jgi:hypothetical protein